MDDRERARIETLDIDHRRMNRLLWRHHPVFALRFVIASHLTVQEFWLPIANSLNMYGAGALSHPSWTGPPSRRTRSRGPLE
jgi:hypothetical protein